MQAIPESHVKLNNSPTIIVDPGLDPGRHRQLEPSSAIASHCTDTAMSAATATPTATATTAKRSKKPFRAAVSSQKRKCISTACIACRKRKSKCDGAVPSCAACASVYGTACIYDPNSDHRRKGVYRENTDAMKADDATLKILVEALINVPDDHVNDLVYRIRNCDNLDNLAQQILKDGAGFDDDQGDTNRQDGVEDTALVFPLDGERDLAGKMGELRLENGTVRFIGGTSHLIYLEGASSSNNCLPCPEPEYPPGSLASLNPIASWTETTKDVIIITHLLNLYFTYHYPYFTTLSRRLFWRDFSKGKRADGQASMHCSSVLVNAMLALGCHLTDVDGAYGVPGDNKTKGDHFFAEAKRLIMLGDEFERPRLVTVQALALMSVREAGCAREATGWVYSGMSFRMALDIGLNLEVSAQNKKVMGEEEIDARRMTFWGCFLFDKCWSNYLGRLPQLPKSTFTVAKFDVFPDEDAMPWMPLTDKGFDKSAKQPSRTRAAALFLTNLCEISSDLLLYFYHPNHIHRSTGKTAELKNLSQLHKRLEEWRKTLPKEFEPGDGQLPNVILMHMFFHLQFIHLFRPFLKYSPDSSPLPPHISPRRICTSNAGAISKLMRLYKKNWSLRQICNIAVYMTHSACTIHLLNLPEKTAKRDFTHGVKHLEKISEDWLCARRTLSILSVLARKWNCVVPDDAAQILQRADELYGYYSTSQVPSPRSSTGLSPQASIEDAAAASHGHVQPSYYYHGNNNSNNNNGGGGGSNEAGPGHAQSHFVLSSMAQTTPPPSSINPRHGVSSHAAAGTRPQRGQTHQQGGLGFDAQNMRSYLGENLEGWGASLMTTTTPPPTSVVYAGTSAAPAPTSGATVATGLLRDIPGAGLAPTGAVAGQGAGLDNNQWILSDSAKWQHNFNGWELGQQPLPDGMQFSFAQPTMEGLDNGAGAAVGSGAGAAAPINAQVMGGHQSGLEMFDTTMHHSRWLPNLE